MDVIQNLFRSLMFFIDNIVYGLIPEIYKIFVYLSELNLYSTDSSNPIHKLVSHIYVLLGIFMLFKVSFSLLQYLVDPSAFRDKSKGMGKLVTNVLVALVLLVSVPFIFEKATELQTTVVQSNAIGQLILGTSMGDLSDDSGENATIEEINTRARDVQFMMFGAFYSLNPAVTESGKPFEACNGLSGVFGSIDMASNSGCLNALNEELATYDDTSANQVTLYSFFKHGSEGTDDRNFYHFDKLLWWKIDGDYVINYLPFISTAAGIYVVLLLITFCVDVAVRVIKLCFLQMLAPIAIVSYIDPKESVSNGKLHNWIKECASTYFSLFLRLATMFLVILLISVISSSVLAEGGYISGQINSNQYSIWLYLFLIIGAFMFAKQVPKMIESIFGIKGSGEFSLNPFKTIGNVLSTPAIAAGGAAVGGALGAAAANTIAAGAPIANNIKTRLDNRFGNNQSFINLKNRVNNVKNAVKPVAAAASPWLGIGAGAISGGIRGARAGYTSKNMLQGAVAAKNASNQARYKRDVNQEANYGLKQRTFDKVSDFAGVKNKDAGLGKMDKEIKTIQKKMSDLDMQEGGVREQMSAYYKHFAMEVLDEAVKSNTYEEYLKTQNVNISRPVSSSTSSTSASTSTSSISTPSYVEQEKPTMVDLNGAPIFTHQETPQASIDLPSGIVDEKTFNEYKNLSSTVDSINAEREELRQQSSRYEDVSKAKDLNKKG